MLKKMKNTTKKLKKSRKNVEKLDKIRKLCDYTI